jgi:hypothetical protein
MLGLTPPASGGPTRPSVQHDAVGIDLSLTCHTHGGVALESISPEIAPSRLVTHYLAGLFQKPGGKLHVNPTPRNGLGTAPSRGPGNLLQGQVRGLYNTGPSASARAGRRDRLTRKSHWSGEEALPGTWLAELRRASPNGPLPPISGLISFYSDGSSPAYCARLGSTWI